jgi:hypothetical protein
MTQSTWSEADSASADIDPTGRLERNCVHFASIASEPRPQQHVLGMKTGEDDYLMGFDICVGVEHVAGNRARDQRVVRFPAGYGRPTGSASGVRTKYGWIIPTLDHKTHSRIATKISSGLCASTG